MRQDGVDWRMRDVEEDIDVDLSDLYKDSSEDLLNQDLMRNYYMVQSECGEPIVIHISDSI
jgi:hypothetical protein